MGGIDHGLRRRPGRRGRRPELASYPGVPMSSAVPEHGPHTGDIEVGRTERMSATAAATWGVAIDVIAPM
jgi:hypothetical protein